ncbi:hypothetical protein [Bacillus cereus group sp. TH228LC]|uniref:hypothetical protein n=1 Tax=Bacillus cereus group sp. TH228LC TaxID=3018049 RepID=UPI0022DF3E41|nr:hypothetical protein [Bacillus cereus group sp. TH228LC]MDA1582123.1 hypothetical protein [Bacillus cereus group sp. TH228LC]
MKLNKQEQTAIIGKLITNILGLGLVKEHIDQQKLEKAVAKFNEVNDNMTPKQEREALISVLDKAIDEFLKV